MRGACSERRRHCQQTDAQRMGCSWTSRAGAHQGPAWELRAAAGLECTGVAKLRVPRDWGRRAHREGGWKAWDGKPLVMEDKEALPRDDKAL